MVGPTVDDNLKAMASHQPTPARHGRIDRQALREGASVTLLFSLPPTLIARFILDNSESTSGWAPLLSLIAIFGFVMGAGVAAWRQTKHTPMLHSVLAGSGVFVVAQAAFLILRVATNGDVRVMRIVSSFSLSLIASVIGGMLGNYLQKSGIRPR